METEELNAQETRVVPSLSRISIKRRTPRPRFAHNDFHEVQRSNNIDVLALSAVSRPLETTTRTRVSRPHRSYQPNHPLLADHQPPQPYHHQQSQSQPHEIEHQPTRRERRPYHNRTELFISSIPRGLNTTGPLEKHFSKFGTVISITTCYENDVKSALIRYSSPAEATAAFRSTEPVLNNRFIKVFWARKSDGVQKRQRERDSLPTDETSVTTVDNRAGSLLIPDKENRTKRTYVDKRHYPAMTKTDPKMLRTLNEQYQLLQESLQNQKLLLGRLEAAKTAKEKHSIKKLLQVTVARIQESRQANSTLMKALNNEICKSKPRETNWLRDPVTNKWVSVKADSDNWTEQFSAPRDSSVRRGSWPNNRARNEPSDSSLRQSTNSSLPAIEEDGLNNHSNRFHQQYNYLNHHRDDDDDDDDDEEDEEEENVDDDDEIEDDQDEVENNVAMTEDGTDNDNDDDDENDMQVDCFGKFDRLRNEFDSDDDFE